MTMRRILPAILILLCSLNASAAQTEICGPGPGTTTPTTWNGFTFYDRSAVLPPGSTVTALSLDNSTPTSARPKIVKRLPPSNSTTLVQNEPLFAHPGGGKAWATLSTPFLVPSDGYDYLPAWWVSGAITRSVEPTQRASKNVDLTGTATFVPDTYGLPAMCAMLGEAPPPPPPPPPGTPNDIWAVLLAQSNAQQMGAGPDFVSTYLSLTTGRTVELFNRAVGSSFLRPFSNYQHWAPGAGGLMDPAVAALQAKLAESVNNTLRGVIIYLGESTSNNIAQVPAVNYLSDLSDRVAYIRQTFGKTPEQLPVIIVEQQISPGAAYPSWAFIQFAQRKATQSGDAYGYIPNSVLVSIADLQGTVDGGLHLGAANNTILQQRLGAAAAALPLP